MDLGKRIRAFLYFLNQLIAPSSTLTAKLEIWEFLWTLHSSSLLFLWLPVLLSLSNSFPNAPFSLHPYCYCYGSSLLFLACLGQQPYNLQNCSRCCQCSVNPLTLTVPRLAEGLVQQPPAPLCLRAFSGLWRLLRLCHGHRKCWGVTLPEAALTIGG